MKHHPIAYHDAVERRTAAIDIDGDTTLRLKRRFSLHNITTGQAVETPPTIYGFADQYDGRYVWVRNTAGSVDVIISHQDANAIAQRRVITPSGVDYVVAADEIVGLIYDGIAERWLIVETSEAAAEMLQFSSGGPDTTAELWLDPAGLIISSSDGQGWVMNKPGSIIGGSIQFDVMNNPDPFTLKVQVIKNGTIVAFEKSLSGTVGNRKIEFGNQRRRLSASSIFAAGDTIGAKILCTPDPDLEGPASPPQFRNVLCLVEANVSH